MRIHGPSEGRHCVPGVRDPQPGNRPRYRAKEVCVAGSCGGGVGWLTGFSTRAHTHTHTQISSAFTQLMCETWRLKGQYFCLKIRIYSFKIIYKF